MALLDRNDFGSDVSPPEGYYRVKLAKGAPWVPCRVYYEDGERGEDGELLGDQVLRCEVAGALVDGPALWATLKQSTSAKITEAEWRTMMETPPQDVNVSQFQRRNDMETVTTNNDGPTQSPSIAALAKALSDAQGKIKGAVKDADNPFFKSRYADLASVWDACRAQLSAAELAVIQTTANGISGVTVITTLAHSSGEWIRGSLTLRPVKDDPQGAGSAITYARRYALAAMVGVAPEDDDGEAASGRDTKTIKKQKAETEAWKANAEAIKQAIDNAHDHKELADSIKADTKALEDIKLHSVTAYEFLMDRVEKRAARLSQKAA